MHRQTNYLSPAQTDIAAHQQNSTVVVPVLLLLLWLSCCVLLWHELMRLLCLASCHTWRPGVDQQGNLGSSEACLLNIARQHCIFLVLLLFRFLFFACLPIHKALKRLRHSFGTPGQELVHISMPEGIICLLVSLLTSNSCYIACTNQAACFSNVQSASLCCIGLL